MTSYLRLPRQPDEQVRETRHPTPSPRSIQRSLLLCLVLLTWLSAGLAHAQTGADKAAAEALFEQARKLMDQGKYAPACEKFEASQQLDSGLGTLLHLADCYEKANLLASAWGTFEEAASLARNRGENERAQIAAVRAAALKPQLIRVVIKVPQDRPEDLEVRRNGRIVPEASYDVPVPVDEGTWKVTASAPGHQPFEATLEARSGGTEPYVVNIPALAKNPTIAAAPQPFVAESARVPEALAEPDKLRGAGEGQKTLGLIVGGAGVVSAIVSGVFSVLASGNASDSKKECVSEDGPGANECSAKGVRLRDDALNQAGVATVTGIIGAVGIGAGTAIYLTAPSDEQSIAGGLVVGFKGAW